MPEDGVEWESCTILYKSFTFLLILYLIMKANINCKGHTSVVYGDDSYLQGDSYESCLKSINDTIIMLGSLSFTINLEKSVLKST